MKEALYYSITDKQNKIVKCHLCPHGCVVKPGKIGLCRARKNLDGKLYSLTYGEFSSIHMDPIEKKPLYHFHPGTKILSVGTIGCNFRCSFCQNWEISQSNYGDIPLQRLSKEDALVLAKENGSIGIAYTYNEPLINYEWVYETSKYFRENDMKNVLVSNGYVMKEPLVELAKYLDAANIDIKAFNNDFYKDVCAGKLDIVLENVRILVERKVHVELTNLIIPGQNDSAKEISALVYWVESLSPDIPLHFSRYFPQYMMETPMTPMDTIEEAYNIAKKKLKYVHMGNV
jgi:pyruvate formate lyase activating enzyme